MKVPKKEVHAEATVLRSRIVAMQGVPTEPSRRRVCVQHSAQVKRCSHKGCPNQAVKGEGCIRHSANKHGKNNMQCSTDGTLRAKKLRIEQSSGDEYAVGESKFV